MSTTIVIIDYGMGNLNSIRNKLKNYDVEVLTSADAEIIKNADKVILPGVGSFKKAMENIVHLNLVEGLNDFALAQKKPILGICLGMQLMTNKSEEGFAEGLGWVDAEVVRFKVKDTLKYKVPHMGWNSINIAKNSKLMKDIPPKSEFYFVHSYHVKTNQSSIVLNETEYEYPFISSIEQDNIYGVQYHPEKSHEIGDILFNNFIDL
mgnify:CR=1 FL=1